MPDADQEHPALLTARSALRRSWPRRRIEGQHQGPTRCLREIEIAGEIPQDGDVFAHCWAWVGPSICLWVKTLTVQEIVFDEFQVGIETKCLVIDVSLLCVRADDNAGNAQTIAILVHLWRDDMIVKAAPIIPGKEDSGAVPVWSLHHGVNQASHVGLADAYQGGRMLTFFAIRRDPRNGGQSTIFGCGIKFVHRLDI